MSDIYVYLLSAFSCFCFLPCGHNAEECSPTVLARRHIFYVPAGGSLSLSCVVQHCGEVWSGAWIRTNPSDVIKPNPRHHLSNLSLSANQTRFILTFLNVNQSDEGFYRCSIIWTHGISDQGHMSYVNITSAVPAHRSVLHRILLCGSAFLCFPILLGLVHCLSSKAEHQPLPRATYQLQTCHAPSPPPPSSLSQKLKRSTHKAMPKSQQKAELVYAALSHDPLEQKRAAREPSHATVYSSLRFS